MKNNIPFFLLLWCSMLFACQRNAFPIEPDAIAPNLPLLSADKNLGLIAGFNASNPSATIDSMDQAMSDALDAGMKIGRLQIDWPELEPSEGNYDEQALLDPLAALRNAGLQTMLTISVYDSDGPVLPDYLEGETMDSPRLQDRFNALMDWVIPELVAQSGFAITIANEPDNTYEENRDLPDQILTFAGRSRLHIRSLDERMAVSITLNHGNLAHSRRHMVRLQETLDYVCMNYYGSPLFPIDIPLSPEEIEDDLTELLEFADGKQMIFQELGMHSDTSLNSSEEIQARFFDLFLERMRQEPQIRAAYVFQLVDWSPETVEIFNQLFDESVPQDFIDNYSTVLRNLGLLRYEDGHRKEAFSRFLFWCETLR